MKTNNVLTTPEPSPRQKAGGGCLEHLVGPKWCETIEKINAVRLADNLQTILRNRRMRMVPILTSGHRTVKIHRSRVIKQIRASLAARPNTELTDRRGAGSVK